MIVKVNWQDEELDTYYKKWAIQNLYGKTTRANLLVFNPNVKMYGLPANKKEIKHLRRTKMTLEEYVNKRINEVDDLRELTKELLTYYYEGWSKEELSDLGIEENEDEN